MKAQEIFDRVVRHLLAQGRKSINDDWICLYRGPDGLRCAVGCLISDAAYDPMLETNNVTTASVRKALRASGIEPNDDVIDLLDELQDAHDMHGPDGWPALLKDIAFERNLSPAVLDEVTP